MQVHESLTRSIACTTLQPATTLSYSQARGARALYLKGVALCPYCNTRVHASLYLPKNESGFHLTHTQGQEVTHSDSGW